MRILANENFPGPIIRELRRRGHDVASVKESMRGASDREVLERAQQEDRLVVTFDKDFGELAYRSKLPATSGVILFRLSGSSPEVDNARALAALEIGIDWAGNFSVVTDDTDSCPSSSRQLPIARKAPWDRRRPAGLRDCT